MDSFIYNILFLCLCFMILAIGALLLLLCRKLTKSIGKDIHNYFDPNRPMK